MHEKILISVVSYREIELEHTVRSFYEDAKYKDRILFSVVSQDYEHPDLSFIPTLNLKYLKVDPKETYGLTWARSIAIAMFSDYDYFLQIDAHMFSVKNWDVDIIEVYKKAKEKFNSPVVLSAYPAMYKRYSNGDRKKGPVLSMSHAVLNGAYFRNWPEHKEAEDLTEHHYIQGACVFSKKEFLLEVPQDPELDFFCDEVCLSIRAFYHRYPIVFFNNPVFFHFYSQDRVAIQSNIKPWNDGHPKLNRLNDTSRGNKFIRGELQGFYGVPKKTINEFCKLTGYIIPLDIREIGVPEHD